MMTVRQSWRKTETGRDKPYSWRRPDARGWFFVPIGWAGLGLALWSSHGDPPSMGVGLRGAAGFGGLAVLVLSALLIAGSGHVWSMVLTMAGAFAVLIAVVDTDPPAARIACLVVALAIPCLAFLSGRAQRGRLPYRYNEPRVVQSSERPMSDYGSWSAPAGSGLLDAPVVLLKRWWNRTDFVLTDVGGEVMARVREIPQPRTDDGMRAAFDFQIEVASRYVIAVEAPGGEPVFFIDGAEIQTGGTVPNGAGLERSFAIVRPDGRHLGREASPFFDGVYADAMDGPGFELDGALYLSGPLSIVDEGNCLVPCTWARRTALEKRQERRYFTLLDADGATFGQFDYGPESPRVRRLIRFRERTPVVLRMAALASMITRGSERRTEVLAPDPSAPEPYPGFGDTHASHYRRLRTFMDQALESRRQQAG